MHELLPVGGVQDMALELSFELQRIAKRLVDLAGAVPLSPEVLEDLIGHSADSFSSPPTLEFDVSGCLGCARELVEEAAGLLVRGAKVTDDDLRREHRRRQAGEDVA